MKRRLTCLLAMDAYGYSRLVGQDEAAALRVLAAHRAVIDGIIAFHEGRIVNTAGDSVLAEFGSVVEGVRCAVEIQDALRTRNEALPEAQRMHFRIGLNLGEVVVRGEDLLGDGVNVAARLQSIAEPGGILVSSSVYDQITGKLDLGFDDIGPQSLKNISRPIRAFRVSGARTPGEATAAPPSPAAQAVVQAATPAPARTRALAIAAVLLVVAAGAVALWQGMLRSPDPAAAPGRDDVARVEAELAAERRARAEAESAAAKAKADAEAAAKAKADADAAAHKARADAAAATARSRSEAASVRPRPPAVESPASDAAARTGAAGAPATASPARPIVSSAVEGAWIAIEDCAAMDALPAFTRRQRIVARDGEFVIERGRLGEPGYGYLSGRPDERGRLVLAGFGISPIPGHVGERFTARFEGTIAAGRGELHGTLGARRCRLVLERASGPASDASAPPR